MKWIVAGFNTYKQVIILHGVIFRFHPVSAQMANVLINRQSKGFFFYIRSNTRRPVPLLNPVFSKIMFL